MKRRHFLATPALPLVPRGQATAAQPPRAPKTWLFWDHWRFDLFQGLDLKQGSARWRPEGTWDDPLLRSMASWPGVWRDRATGKWRMLYTANWSPVTLCALESDDGVRWRPLATREIQPAGTQKSAPHHVFTFPNGSAGGLYIDPAAGDGFPFKYYAIQSGPPAWERARADRSHPLHAYADRPGPKHYLMNHLGLVSKDGTRWQADHGLVWNQPHWQPEPPVFAYYNPHLRLHVMTARPGHGDRRIVIQTSRDARTWSGPELALQPDPLDPPLIQFYGMPVIPYEGQYVGLLWVMHAGDVERMPYFNHAWAPLDCQLAYSFDGLRFQRALRQPFVALNEPGQPASGLVQPSAMVDAGDELRIYSTASPAMHAMERQFKHRLDGLNQITLHTLRRDGFMFVESHGAQGQFLSKPMVLRSGGLEINAAAPYGEIRWQVTDIKGEPVRGFAFEQNVAFREADRIRAALQWKDANPEALRNRTIRLQARLQNARLYAVRGDFHFLDANDMHRLEAGVPLDTRWFDY